MLMKVIDNIRESQNQDRYTYYYFEPDRLHRLLGSVVYGSLSALAFWYASDRQNNSTIEHGPYSTRLRILFLVQCIKIFIMFYHAKCGSSTTRSG